jgi:Holliday junction DNA helicase RuvB
MARERVVSATAAQAQPEEEARIADLRPKRLEEYIGQRKVIELLKISLAAAKKRKEPLDHVLFHGPPGLGKTTLAHVIAAEMGRNIRVTSGPAITKQSDLMADLTNLEEGDILFIDEIHRLSAVVQEFIYPAMEDFKVDFTVGEGQYARTINLPLKRFTLIGATTRAGLLSAPMRARFGIPFHLEFYEPDELQVILTRSARLLGVGADPDALMEIARRSRGTPRVANRLLYRVRDYAQVKGDGRITVAMAKAALELWGVDPLGLDELDRTVLKTIVEHYDGGPVGVEAIAATLNEEVDTLVDLVEPYLLKIGFLGRSKRGRVTLSRGFEHLGIKAPRVPRLDDGQNSLF